MAPGELTNAASLVGEVTKGHLPSCDSDIIATYPGKFSSRTFANPHSEG